MNLALLTLHTANLDLLLEQRMRNPSPALPRRTLLKHGIDLLEAQALGLRHTPPRKQHARGARRAPHEEDLGLQVAVLGVDHVRGDEADDEVPEPVRRRRQSDALGADG